MRFTRVLIYALFVTASLGIINLVSSSWSPEALFLHPFLMPSYFVVTTLLFLAIMSDRVPCSVGDKLALIIIHSFLTRIVSIIFFYPGTSGDNAYHLAHAKSFDIFGQYYAALTPGGGLELLSTFERLFLFQRASIQYGLVTALSKTLYIDVLWIHMSIVSVLWSLFVPIIGFKISKTLGTSNRACLLTGILVANVPLVIGWSHQTVANSLGFFFFFVGIYFLVKSLSSKNVSKYIILALLTAVISLLTHALTGIVSFMVILLAVSVKKYFSFRKNHPTRASIFLAVSFLTCVMLLPAASVLMYLVYPTYSSFSLQKILTMDIHVIVLANYASYSTIEALMYGTLTFLGIIGMVLYSRHDNNRNLGLFMILAFAVIVAEYRVHLYFVTTPLFGVGRFITFEPFVIAPFASIAIEYLITATKLGSSAQLNPSPSKNGIMSKLMFPRKQTLTTILICLGLSALIVEGVLTDFQGLGFRREPYGILSVYSIEAATLIHEEYLRTEEKYVVVSDAVSETAGMAVVGRSNPNEFYLYRYSNSLLLYDLLHKLSFSPLLSATWWNDAKLVYVIVSKNSVKRNLGPRADPDQIMNSLSRVLGPPMAIVGEGERQVYVFRFRAERTEGIGPSAIIYKDSQKAQLNATYSYWTLENVEYSLNLTGATTYDICEWPKHWSYEEISPTPINASIDANNWINFTGQLNVIYTVKWVANNFYTDVSWKDDSFLEGWKFNSARGNYSFTSDGDAANETIAGSPGGFVYYKKELPSLQGSLSFQIRVEGEPNSYFFVLLWGTREDVHQIVLNTKSKPAPLDYETYTFDLPTDAIISQIWLASYTGDGSSSVIYWDYVMFTQLNHE